MYISCFFNSFRAHKMLPDTYYERNVLPRQSVDLQHLDEKTKKLIPKRASDSSNSEDDGEGISFSNVDDSVDKVTVTATKQSGEW